MQHFHEPTLPWFEGAVVLYLVDRRVCWSCLLVGVWSCPNGWCRRAETDAPCLRASQQEGQLNQAGVKIERQKRRGSSILRWHCVFRLLNILGADVFLHVCLGNSIKHAYSLNKFCNILRLCLPLSKQNRYMRYACITATIDNRNATLHLLQTPFPMPTHLHCRLYHVCRAWGSYSSLESIIDSVSCVFYLTQVCCCSGGGEKGR